jgi:hypothetical protein
VTEPPIRPERRPLHVIAKEIHDDWGNRMHFAAVPYARAMLSLGDLRDTYGKDSAESIVRYFLSNARTWQGPIARRVKDELNSMLDRAG